MADRLSSTEVGDLMSSGRESGLASRNSDSTLRQRRSVQAQQKSEDCLLDEAAEETTKAEVSFGKTPAGIGESGFDYHARNAINST